MMNFGKNMSKMNDFYQKKQWNLTKINKKSMVLIKKIDEKSTKNQRFWSAEIDCGKSAEIDCADIWIKNL